MARPRKPRVLVKCVANTYTQPHERIIEVSFPERTDIGQMPGCLIRLNNSTPPHKPRVEVYRTDGEVDVLSPRKKYYAAFVGGSYGQEISLHRTKREAMEEVARTFDIPLTTEEDPPQVRDDDELSEAFDEHCSSRADDWHVNEVAEP